MQRVESLIVDAGHEQFSQLPELDGHLGAVVFKSLASKPFRKMIVDLSTGRKEMKAGIFLAAAIAVSRRLKKIKSRRVGVVFPSGIAGSLTNLALTIADKVPVNINFTSGRKAIASSIVRSEMTHIVTARPMMDKLPDFPWTDEIIDIQNLLKSIGKAEILYWYAMVLTVPAPILMRWLGVPQKGGRREAAILFSSGSTGDPKGVILSHRNIIGNCLQIKAINLFHDDDVVMANLPIFHSFGFTVTMWFPMIKGIKTVCLPNPLETRRVAQAIHDEKVTFLIGTPSLLRPYIKKIEPEMLKSLRVTAAGAEKTPAGFAALWENTFGSKYIVGYGITETSPVVAGDLSEYDPATPGGIYPGTTGPLFPGMQACVIDDATGNVIEPTQQGVIMLRGPNVFEGYLGDLDATSRAISDGWFRTGDIGRFDEKGNLYIEGRVSRFSKIGGEMVPHGTVEQAVVAAYHLEDSEAPMVAITGATDDAKGECLVLFTALDIDASDLRAKLAEQAIPNLWMPRRIRRVEKIPCLASGKLDLATLKRIAQEAVSAEEEAV